MDIQGELESTGQEGDALSQKIFECHWSNASRTKEKNSVGVQFRLILDIYW
jgi:hypothetical protein